MNKMRVGIIGCGAIGAEIAKACEERLNRSFVLTSICDADSAKTEALKRLLKSGVKVCDTDTLIKDAQLVIEVASASISAGILKKCIAAKKDVLIMSVGGLLGNEGLLKEAEESGTKVYIPSGAVCGIDGLKAGGIGSIDSAILTTRKPPKGLAGAPYLKEKNIDIGGITKETVIFEGDALEAVKAFPQNVNVCAVLSLAGIGAAKTRVRIVSSPEYAKNVHEIEISGDFGRITTRTENVPSKANPKTSALAFQSAIALLEGIAKNVKIGT